MKRQKKKSSQKQFMQTMIITGILGLSIMMIIMLYMIKLFGPKKAEIVPEHLAPVIENKKEEDVDSKELKGVVHEIGIKKTNIKIWDIKDKEYLVMYIKDKSQITDSYGKPMSIQEIELGDIVEVTYESKKKTILTIQKSAKSWTKTGVSQIDINTNNQTIQIGNSKYDYSKDIIITNSDLKVMELEDINSLDTLVVKGIDNTVWSIQVVQSAGYLKLSNIPTRKGSLEVGNNTIYRLGEIGESIALPSGENKIVIRMEGYQPFVKQVRISANEIQELDLKGVEEAVANLKIRVVNTETDYEAVISNRTYKKDEAIMLQPGTHTLKIISEGFKTFEMDIQLEEGDRQINISLEAKEEVKPELEGEKLNQEKPADEKSDKEPPKTSEEEKPEEEIKTVQIVIETDPTGAQVFLNGVNKGTTPTLTGLKPGEYSITIEKEGYSPLYSTIIIDASNAQKGFLYTLQEEQ